MENSELLVSLGKNLRLMREKKKLSQADAAAKSGMKQGYISRLEQGEINITYTNLAQYCKAIGCTPIHVV